MEKIIGRDENHNESDELENAEGTNSVCFNFWAEKKEYYPLMLFVNFLLPLFSGETMIQGFCQKLRFSHLVI